MALHAELILRRGLGLELPLALQIRRPLGKYIIGSLWLGGSAECAATEEYEARSGEKLGKHVRSLSVGYKRNSVANETQGHAEVRASAIWREVTSTLTGISGSLR